MLRVSDGAGEVVELLEDTRRREPLSAHFSRWTNLINVLKQSVRSPGIMLMTAVGGQLAAMGDK